AHSREVDPRAGAAFEDESLVAVPVQDRVHVVVDLQDEAGRALRLGLDADVEVHRAVEGGALGHQQGAQLGFESVAAGVVGEVALALAPSGYGVDHPADELANAGLASGAVKRPTKILRYHHVGGGLRPGARNLDVALFKNHPAVLAGDHGRAQLPLDLAHRVDAGTAEKALKHEPGARYGLDAFRCFWWFFVQSRHRHFASRHRPILLTHPA